jgi:hypothetical protein
LLLSRETGHFNDPPIVEVFRWLLLALQFLQIEAHKGDARSAIARPLVVVIASGSLDRLLKKWSSR